MDIEDHMTPERIMGKRKFEFGGNDDFMDLSREINGNKK